jgi:GAF domain-containing protein
MDALRNFFRLHYVYTNPADQRRAQGLLSLNAFALALAGGLVLILLTAGITGLSQVAMAALIPMLALLVWVSVTLIQNGHLNVAIGLYLGTAWLSSLALVASIGLTSSVVVVLGFPIIAAGVLLDRNGVRTMTVLVLLSVFLLGFLEQLVLRPGTRGVMATLPVMVALGFYGLILWLFAGEFRATFERLAQAERRMQAGVLLSEVIAHTTKPNVLPGQLNDMLRGALGLQRLRIFLQDEQNLALLRLQSESGVETRQERRTISLSTASPLTEAFRTGKPVLVTTNDLSSRWREFLPGTRAELVLPLQVGDKLIGVMDLLSAEENSFTEENTSTLITLASQVGLAIHNADLTDKLAQQDQDIAHLYEQTQRYAQNIERLNRQILGVAWQRFFEERRTTVIGYDYTPDEPLQTAQTLTPALSAAIDSGQVMVQTEEDGCLLSVPIILRGQPLGAMEFHFAGRRDVPSHIRDLVTTVAERLSLAIDNARLFERAQFMAERERQISAVASRLQSAARLEDLLALAAQEFNSVLSGYRTHIRLQIREQPALATPEEAAPSPAPTGSNGHADSGGAR